MTKFLYVGKGTISGRITNCVFQLDVSCSPLNDAYAMGLHLSDEYKDYRLSTMTNLQTLFHVIFKALNKFFRHTEFKNKF